MSLQTSSFNLSGVLSPPSGSVLSGQCSLWSLWGHGCGSTSSPTTFSLYEYFYSVRARWRSPRTLALMTLVFSPYFLLLFRYSGPPSGSSAFAGQGSLRSPTTFFLMMIWSLGLLYYSHHAPVPLRGTSAFFQVLARFARL